MATEQPLAGRGALVTGASAGIGRETARALARDGADVAISARREGRLTDLAGELEDEHGVAAVPVAADVREEGDVDRMVETAVEELGGLDALVNNAGVSASHGEPVDERSTEDFQTTLQTNVVGTFFATRAALPYLRAADGANLVFVGSFAGQYPRPKNPTYAATKWWVRGFAHSLEGDVGEDGVGVTVVNPSEVRTEWSAGGAASKERFEEGEVTEPEEVAEAIAFALAMPYSSASEIDVYRPDKLSHF